MTLVVKPKAEAMPFVPQDRPAAVALLGEIGDLRRRIAGQRAAADESVRAIVQAVEDAIAPLVAELHRREVGLQAYCEANRASLTDNLKRKFHEFATGRISWRKRPPSVVIPSEIQEAVIASCKRLGFLHFVRVKEEVNREAILADRAAAAKLEGLTIQSPAEIFSIEPAELQTSAAA